MREVEELYLVDRDRCWVASFLYQFWLLNIRSIPLEIGYMDMWGSHNTFYAKWSRSNVPGFVVQFRTRPNISFVETIKIYQLKH